MRDGHGSPSAPRRAVSALARIGLDMRPLLRRARDAILRPVRHELTVTTNDARRDFAVHLAAMATRLDEAADERHALEERLAAMAADAAAETKKREALEAQLAAMATRLDQAADERHALEAKLAAMADARAAEANKREDLDARLAEMLPRVDAGEKEYRVGRTRMEVLERLITEADSPTLPAVRQWLHETPSPIVSVILPTRDRARFICDAIASVQAQHFADWELIVIDDGSTDDTAVVVAPYLEDRRIRYIKRPHQGVAAARNSGLGLARGTLVAYLDSDNIWYSGFLAAAVRAFAAEPDTNVIYGALVSNSHELDGTQLLWMPFDRDRLISVNYIDTNVLMHRKSMVERYGAFDETLTRYVDWDLILRYTEHFPARALPILAARYRECDDQRISDRPQFAPELFAVRRKWYPPPTMDRRPRVLYVLWQYPQLSETYIEAEIRCMSRWGAHIEVWRDTQPTTPHPTSVPIHDGPLAEAVLRVRPDVIHVHWVGFAVKYAAKLDELGIPVTVRLHGFDSTPEACRAMLAKPWIRAVYGFPHHLDLIDRNQPRLRAVPVAFDTTLFRPSAEKDRRLVLRAAAALPSKDLEFFFEVANRLPDYHFVLAAITCTDVEPYVDACRTVHRRMKSSCELMFDVPHADLARLMERAGIYLHTARPPGTEYATSIGMPISIAEAMATGAYVLVRDLPELRSYVGDAGTGYRDADHAAELIGATAEWSAGRWNDASTASVNRAFLHHADELALRPIFEDWCEVTQQGAVASTTRKQSRVSLPRQLV